MKNNLIRRITALLLSVCMILSLAMPTVAAGLEDGATPTEPEILTATYAPGGAADNDELFDQYVQMLFYGGGVQTYATTYGRDSLSSDLQAYYDFLLDKINAVANGTLTSTQFDASAENIIITAANVEEYKQKTSKVIDALLLDCSYELYWFDKTKGAGTSYIFEEGTTSYSLVAVVMSVAPEYKGSQDFSTDSTKISAAKKAVTNAQSIVSSAPEGDAEKVKYFKDEICKLVSYDDDAVKDGAAYGDSFQLTNVFDGVDSTKVVCEGYSKAFKYLCELSGIKCYTVTGNMDGGTGAGAHMWNLVVLDGKSYVVDVTNCDSGTIGAPDKLCLKGVAELPGKSLNEGYTIAKVKYTYDSKITSLLSKDVLTPSTEDYGATAVDKGWTLDETTGVLTIKTQAGMTNWATYRKEVPQYELLDVKSVVIGSDVTSIADLAFANCSGIKDITIPKNIESIGSSAFGGCGLTSVTMLRETPPTIVKDAFNGSGLKDGSIEVPSGCAQAYKDAWGNVSADYAPLIKPDPHTHAGTLQKGQAATCTADGWSDYYKCTCDKLFADETCTTEITLEDWKTGAGKLAKTEHTYPETYETDSTSHWQICTACNQPSEHKDHTYSSEGICPVCKFNAGWTLGARSLTIFGDEGMTNWCASRAKYASNVNSLTIMSDVTAIGDEAFKECLNLTSATMKSVTPPTIGKNVFSGTGLTDGSIKVPSGCAQTYKDAWTDYANLIMADPHTHIGTLEKGQPATCSAEGWSDYYTCTCGNLFEDKDCTKPIASLDEWKTGAGKLEKAAHTFTLTSAKDATCAVDGNIAYNYCSACKKYFDEAGTTEITLESTVVKAAHEFTLTAAKDATCTVDGNSAYNHCSVCNKYFNEAGTTEIELADTVIKAAHKLTLTAAKDPTCTANGNIAYNHCSVCDKYFNEAGAGIDLAGTVIPAKGHTMTPTVAKEPTCTEPGNIAHYKCSVCDKLFEDIDGKTETTSDKIVVAAKDHTLTLTAAKDPTCTADGNIAYNTCSVCNKYFSADGKTEITFNDTIVKAAHKLTLTAAKDATCTADGNIAYNHCSVCNKYFNEAGTAEIDLAGTVVKAGHKLTLTEAKEANCTEAGNIAYNHCFVCDEYFSADGKTEITLDDTVIAAKGHDLTLTEAKEPTCTTIGNKAYYTCSGCDKLFEYADGKKEITDRASILLPAAHKLTLVPAKDPTATADGNKAYYTCSVCEKWFEDAEGKTEITDKASVIIPATTADIDVNNDTKPSENAGNADIASTEAELQETVSKTLTEEEKEAVNNGAAVSIYVKVTDIDDTVTAADRTAVESKLDGAKVGMYLDISLFKKVGDAAASPITEIEGGITLSFKVPDELIKDGRSYKIIRVHDNAADVINGTFDSATKLFTFKTDRFSTYAFSYSDAPHSHTLEFVKAIAANCKTQGRIAHYHCDGCGKNFSDSKGENEIVGSIFTAIDKTKHAFSNGLCRLCGMRQYPFIFIPRITYLNDTYHFFNGMARLHSPNYHGLYSDDDFEWYVCGECGHEYGKVSKVPTVDVDDSIEIVVDDIVECGNVELLF